MKTRSVKGPSNTPGTDFRKANENIMNAKVWRLPVNSKLTGEVGVSHFKGFVPDYCAKGKDPFEGNYEGVSSLKGGFVPPRSVKSVREQDYSIYDKRPKALNGSIKRPKALNGSIVDMYCSSVRNV